jgi:antitoxin (DNA-binding transcriptional repressor) of toxin-antitoxin stability system
MRQAHHQIAREVSVTELRRAAASVIRRVGAGELAVISRHGRPVALMLAIGDPETLLPAEVEPGLLAELAGAFVRRARWRRISELNHGRWYHGHGIHGPYKRRRDRPG